MECKSDTKVPSAIKISVSSPKHADPQVRGCSLEGRNIVSRSVRSILEWDCRLSRPLCSLGMGSGDRVLSSRCDSS